MSEPIDELLVKLGLETDAKGFKEANNQFTNMRTTALATGAAVVGAFAGAVKMSADVAKSADDLAKWSRTAGVTAQYASKLGFAMAQVGGDGSDARGLIELANSLRDSAQWGELSERAFTAAGFNPQRIEQENMSPEQVVDFLSQGLSAMQLDQRRQIAGALGVSDKAFRLLSDRQGMQSNFQRVDELGGIPTDELLANAEAYTAATTEFKQAVEGFKQSIANEMLPGMTQFFEGVTGWSVDNQDEINEFLAEAMPYLKATAAGIGVLVAVQAGKKGLAMLAAGAGSAIAAGPVIGALGLAAFYADEEERESAKGAWKGSTNYWKRQIFGIDPDDPRFTPNTGPGGGVPELPDSYLAPAPAPETKEYRQVEEEQARRKAGPTDVPFDALFDALINQESGGRHYDENGRLLTSPAGARGIAQIMPATGRDPGYGIDPLAGDSKEEHLRFGRDYLTAMIRTFDGDTRKALAAYNAGSGAVQKAVSKHGDHWLSAMPGETQAYVPSIMAQAERGGATNYYSIDARGSTDPAATAEALGRVMDERIANIVQVSRDGIPKNVQ